MNTNARRAKKVGKLRSFVERLASSYNGNLKMVFCCSSRFGEDTKAHLFGRLTEVKICGISVPNPKKAFLGRTFSTKGGCLRFCLIGAHFPVQRLAKSLET